MKTRRGILSVAAALAATSAVAQKVKIFPEPGAASSAPQPAFTAGGAHFDGSSCIINDSLFSGANTDKIGISMWLKAAAQNASVFAIDSSSNGGGLSVLTPVAPYAAIGKLYDSPGVSFVNPRTSTPVCDGSWHNLILGYNGTSGDSAMMLDGVSINNLAETPTGIPFVFELQGQDFNIGTFDGLTAFFTGDLAEFWLTNSSDLMTAGVISPTTVAKFYSGGHPVDLGPDGSTPTGTTPAIYLHRSTSEDANIYFPVNRGTGRNFDDNTGTLTNSGTNP